MKMTSKIVLILFSAMLSSITLKALNCTAPTSLTIAGVTNVCSGSSTSLSATANGTDINTSYSWYGPSGFTANTAAVSNVNTAGVYKCIISNGIGCVDSISTTVQIIATVLPSIAISSSGNIVCSDATVNFNSSVTNGGISPSYQWSKNGLPILGATSATLSLLASSLVTNDIISCTLISSAICANPSTVSSNSILMTINQIPNLSINPPGGFVCPGSPNLIMTATGATSFSWSPATGLNNTNTSQVTAYPSSNTTYTITGTSNGCSSTANVTVNYNASGSASLLISASQTNICAGTNVVFTASPVGGGTLPTYQWKKNGNNINGATAYLFTSNTLNNNDIITCVMNSNDPCVTNTNATSNSITMTVTPTSTPGVTIAASATNICNGTPVTFNATPSFGGASPGYYWKVNSVLVNNSGSTFVTNALSNQDTVKCTMISNQACATPSIANSNQIIVAVSSLSSPTISISASQSNICSGTSVTFTSNITNGGTTPSYQWKKNGINILGANTSSYSTTNLLNNDAISCELTSSSICANPTLAISNSVVINVTPTATASVSVGSTAGTLICAGASAIFIAAPVSGGTSPIFQWYYNGALQAGQTGNSFIPTNTISNHDSIRCVMTSSAICLTQNVVSSSSLEMTVLPNVTSSLNITSTATNICSGSEVIFTAHAGQGITNPLFQWRVNGVNIPQSTDSVFKSRNLQNGDNITALLFSSAECLSSNNISSNSIIVNVNQSNFGLVFTADTQTPSAQSLFKVNLTNSTTTTSNKKFIWYYGDGTSYEGFSPEVHYYPSNGIYTVALRVVDMNTMCADSMSKKDYITCVGGLDCTQSISLTPAMNNISGCIGGSVLIKCTTNAANPTYQWNNNGIPMGGETNSSFLATTNGNYSVTVYANGGCPITSQSKVITFNNAAPAAPIITQTANLLSCTPDTITLTASSGFGSYLWNNGSTNQNVQVHQSGVYTVMGTMSEGCNRQSDPLAINASAVSAPPICMVTVDTSINKNILIWQKPITSDIDSFVVFKQTEPFVYTRLGSQPYSAISEFLDTTSHPLQSSDVYKLAAVDNCGNLTLPSIFHRTIHLQITPGIGYSRNLSWSNQLGFSYDSCIIYRGHFNSWTAIATISSQENLFVDYPEYNTLDTSYLVVVKVPGSGCTSTKFNNTAKVRSTSNNSSNRNLVVFGVGINEASMNESIEFYPNPVESSLLVKNYNKQLLADIFVFSLLGATVNLPIIKTCVSSAEIDCSSLTQGIYVLQIGNTYRKFVKK